MRIVVTVVLLLIGAVACTTNVCTNDCQPTTEPTIAKWRAACPEAGASGACACVDMALWSCMLRKGCYKEAGDHTSVTQQDLRNSCTLASDQARALNTDCGLTCP